MTKQQQDVADKILKEISESGPEHRRDLINQYNQFLASCEITNRLASTK